MDLSRRHCGRTQVPRRNCSPVMRDAVRFGFRFVPPLSVMGANDYLAKFNDYLAKFVVRAWLPGFVLPPFLAVTLLLSGAVILRSR